jgi:hypothetical protein
VSGQHRKVLDVLKVNGLVITGQGCVCEQDSHLLRGEVNPAVTQPLNPVVAAQVRAA